jgi:hypothetical protein
MEVLERVPADAILGPIPEDPLHRGALVDDRAVAIHDDLDVDRVLDERAEPLLAAPKLAVLASQQPRRSREGPEQEGQERGRHGPDDHEDVAPRLVDLGLDQRRVLVDLVDADDLGGSRQADRQVHLQELVGQALLEDVLLGAAVGEAGFDLAGERLLEIVVFSEPLITRFGARAVLRASLVLELVALVWFARLPVDVSYLIDVAPSLALMGIGSGLAFPALVGLAMSGATREDAGLASGLVNTTRQVGGALGLAAMASAATMRGASLTASGASASVALTGGSQIALELAAGFVLLALVVAMTILPSGSAARAAETTSDDEEAPDFGAIADAA